MSSKRIIIVGEGGHASVLKEALEASGKEVTLMSSRDEDILRHTPNEAKLVVGLGTIGNIESMDKRVALIKEFQGKGYEFETVIHPSAIISPTARIEAGAQVMAGVIIQARARVGAQVIVNSGAVVEHDCLIGDACHLAPGSVLSGGVELGEQTHVGTAASIIQGLKIGRKSLVAAGAVVTRSLPEGSRVGGIPAKSL